MVKRLTIVRHAKAVKGYPDIERALNERGENQAQAVGQRLVQRQIYPDIILSSPARRALDTARILAAEIDFPEEKILIREQIYSASLSDLLTVLQEINDSHADAMLVGHNPIISALANYLADSSVGELPTCGTVRLDFSATSWRMVENGSGVVAFAERALGA